MPESTQEMLARVERLTTNSPGAYFSLAPIDRAALCYVLESRAKLLDAAVRELENCRHFLDEEVGCDKSLALIEAADVVLSQVKGQVANA